jgi:hypothetical protein
MRILAATVAMLAMVASPAQAWTVDGYMTAGGAGQVKCPIFQNAVAEGRSQGLSTLPGIRRVENFVSYALGYYTRYNEDIPGVYDILDGVRGDNLHVSLLTILDNWCADNPTADFNDALDESVRTLYPSAKLGPTLPTDN